MSYTPPMNKSYMTTVTTGFNDTVPDGITIAIYNSSIALLVGTIKMPENPTDGQPLTIISPKGVVALAIQPNTGQTFSATPIAVMAANAPYRLKYSAINSTWYNN